MKAVILLELIITEILDIYLGDHSHFKSIIDNKGFMPLLVFQYDDDWDVNVLFSITCERYYHLFEGVVL